MRRSIHTTVNRHKKILIIGGCIVLVAAIVCLVFVLTHKNTENAARSSTTSSSSSSSPSQSSDTTTNGTNNQANGSTNGNGTNGSSNAAGDKSTSSVTDVTGQASTLDPATVGSITIDPMNITVSYVKGVGGFEYEVHRTASGTQYVDFMNSDLVGTKCTDDQGVFATILESPGTDEQATLSKTIKLANTTYGLSLAAATCTGDTMKLTAYQKSFDDAFSLLKKTE